MACRWNTVTLQSVNVCHGNFLDWYRNERKTKEGFNPLVPDDFSKRKWMEKKSRELWNDHVFLLFSACQTEIYSLHKKITRSFSHMTDWRKSQWSRQAADFNSLFLRVWFKSHPFIPAPFSYLHPGEENALIVITDRLIANLFKSVIFAVPASWENTRHHWQDE